MRISFHWNLILIDKTVGIKIIVLDNRFTISNSSHNNSCLLNYDDS